MFRRSVLLPSAILAGLIAAPSLTHSSVTGSATPYQNPSEGILQLSVQDDTLTVDLKDAAIDKVLQQISTQAHIQIISDSPLEKRVTVLFRGLPLDQGLKKILRGQDTMFLYTKTEGISTSPDGYRLKEVRLYGEQSDKAVSRPAVPSLPPNPPPLPNPPRLPASRKPIPTATSRDRKEIPQSPPPAEVRKPPERALPGIMEGNMDQLQDIVKNLQEDNPQLQDQIDKFVDSLEEARSQAEKEGLPFPPPDQMGAVGQMIQQMLKDKTTSPQPAP